MPTTCQPVSVRRTTFADYEQIACVQTANNLDGESREEWLHMWLGNPAHKTCAGGWPVGWVLEAKDRGIVGTISNIPLAYSFRGTKLMAAAGRGWAVDDEYRAYSLRLLGRFVSQSNVNIYLVTTAGRKSATALTKLHWSRAPVGRWDSCGFWITCYSGFIESCLRLTSVPGKELLCSLLKPPLFALDRVAWPISSRHSGEFDLRFSNSFDDRFDQFWTELEFKKRHMLLAIRTKEVLNWRFKYAIAKNQLWILTAVAGEKLLGYGIFARRDVSAVGLKRLRLIDLQTLAQDKILCSAILSCALDRCRKEGIHILEDWGCWLENGPLLNRSAPYHRNLGAWSYFYRISDAGLGNALADADCWYPTSFDGDSSL